MTKWLDGSMARCIDVTDVTFGVEPAVQAFTGCAARKHGTEDEVDRRARWHGRAPLCTRSSLARRTVSSLPVD